MFNRWEEEEDGSPFKENLPRFEIEEKVCDMSQRMYDNCKNLSAGLWVLDIKRGLRQRCALSLFLFNIVAEALRFMMRKAEKIGMCRRVEIGNNGFSTSQLQYADDTILFYNLSLENLLVLKRMFSRSFEPQN